MAGWVRQYGGCGHSLRHSLGDCCIRAYYSPYYRTLPASGAAASSHSLCLKPPHAACVELAWTGVNATWFQGDMGRHASNAALVPAYLPPAAYLIYRGPVTGGRVLGTCTPTTQTRNNTHDAPPCPRGAGRHAWAGQEDGRAAWRASTMPRNYHAKTRPSLPTPHARLPASAFLLISLRAPSLPAPLPACALSRAPLRHTPHALLTRTPWMEHAAVSYTRHTPLRAHAPPPPHAHFHAF